MYLPKIDDFILNSDAAIQVVSLDSEFARELFRRTTDGYTEEEVLGASTEKYLLGKTLRQIKAQTFPPRRFAVEGMIYTGVTLLSGQPKVGKSYYALQLAAAVASGQPFLGRPTRQGTVLYLALEDDELRIFERTRKMLYHDDDGVLDNLRIETEENWENHCKDPLGDLRRYGLACDGELSLIVIDTLQCFRGSSVEDKGNIYAVDNAYMKSLRHISVKTNTPILLINHTKKNTTGDYITDGSGSMGLAGGAATVMTFYRDATQNHGVIQGAGKDVEAFEEWVCWDQSQCRFAAVPVQDVPDECLDIMNPEAKKKAGAATGRGPNTEQAICQAVLRHGQLTPEGLIAELRRVGVTTQDSLIRTLVVRLCSDKLLKVVMLPDKTKIVKGYV